MYKNVYKTNSYPINHKNVDGSCHKPNIPKYSKVILLQRLIAFTFGVYGLKFCNCSFPPLAYNIHISSYILTVYKKMYFELYKLLKYGARYAWVMFQTKHNAMYTGYLITVIDK